MACISRIKSFVSFVFVMASALHGADVREKIVHEKRIDRTPFLSLDHDYTYVWCKMRNASIINFGENKIFQEKKIPAALMVKENDIVQIPISMNFRVTINGVLVFHSELSKGFADSNKSTDSHRFVDYIRIHDTRMSDPVNGNVLKETWLRQYPRDRYLATSASMPILNGKEFAPKPKE